MAPQRRHRKGKRIRIRQNREVEIDPWVSKVIVDGAGGINTPHPPTPPQRGLGRETGCILRAKTGKPGVMRAEISL